MSNFIETRGMLAKLLATENLIIEHDPKASTAGFNTKDRILTLPVLDTNNEFVYNMMCAHEVGHALHTPPTWWDDVPKDVPFDFVNVIEDVRIEKSIQSKFPGLKRDFRFGYDELHQKDFFGVLDEDISTKSFIDRINLHFKLGSRAVVPFSDEEMTYVKAVDEVDTWDKVLLISSMICDYLKAKQDNNQETKVEVESESTNKNGEQSTSRMNSDEGDEEENSNENNGEGADNQVDEFQSETQERFDSNLEELTSNNYQDLVYVKLPKKFDNIIISCDELRNDYNYSTGDISRGLYGFQSYLKEIRSDVMFMVQQFEMRKSADAHARTKENKTGELNVNRLFDYKLTDDIFLRQSVTPDGKSHGMVMLLDWSGSMCNITISVVKQIITLVQFCRKVQIPFKVMTFTSNNNFERQNYDLTNVDCICPEGISLVEVVSSSSKNRDIDTDLLHLWCEGHHVEHSSSLWPHSNIMEMGGTPLNNVLTLMPSVIEEFKSKTKTQKVSFVCVTDGESSPVYHYSLRKGYTSHDYITPCYSHYCKVMLRDGSNVISLGGMSEQTTHLAHWLETKVKDISVINIFLGTQTRCSNYCSNQKITDFYTHIPTFKKEGGVTFKSKGWNTIVLINPKTFTPPQTEIEVDDGSSKSKIKSAFKKFMKSKQSNKAVLASMVETLA